MAKASILDSASPMLWFKLKEDTNKGGLMTPQNNSISVSRRSLMGLLASTSLVALPLGTALAQVPPSPFLPPVPIPAQAPFKEGVAELPGTKLYYRDSGGNGPVVVFMHPATGSAMVWDYQQPAFVKAGYRVIAYSRRGYFGSQPADKDNGGTPSKDLGALMDFLGVQKFALVASAAGCTITLDYAMDHSDRLTAIAVAGGSYGELDEPEYQEISKSSRVKGFDEMPGYFRELGPSYRAANLAGTKAWDELEHKALSGNRLGPKNANKFNWTTLAKIKAPTLFIAGGSDLAAPPTMMRLVAAHVPNAKMVVMSDVGHSTYWELPDLFNQIILDFFSAHK